MADLPEPPASVTLAAVPVIPGTSGHRRMKLLGSSTYLETPAASSSGAAPPTQTRGRTQSRAPSASEQQGIQDINFQV